MSKPNSHLTEYSSERIMLAIKDDALSLSDIRMQYKKERDTLIIVLLWFLMFFYPSNAELIHGKFFATKYTEMNLTHH